MCGWFLVSCFSFLVEKQVFTVETTRNLSNESIKIHLIVLIESSYAFVTVPNRSRYAMELIMRATNRIQGYMEYDVVRLEGHPGFA